jgi:Rod binding domain-containing protein
MQGDTASHRQLAEALAHQEAAKLAASGALGAGDEVLEQIRTYQERILELEAQVTMQAKAIKAQNDAVSNGKSISRGAFLAC